MMIKLLIICIILQGMLVITSKNSVTSVLYLIGIYLLTSICFLIVGAEFLAILLVIIYVGAVSILFIFVVMMLNIRILEVYYTIITYLPIGLFFGFFFMFEIIYMLNIDYNIITYYSIDNTLVNLLGNLNYKNNLYHIGIVLFNYYYFFVWYAGLVLFLAIIGAVALTLNSFIKMDPLSDINFFLKYKNKSSNLNYLGCEKKIKYS